MLFLIEKKKKNTIFELNNILSPLTTTVYVSVPFLLIFCPQLIVLSKSKFNASQPDSASA